MGVSAPLPSDRRSSTPEDRGNPGNPCNAGITAGAGARDEQAPGGRDGGPRMRAVRFEDVPEVLRLVRRAVEHGCHRHYNREQRHAVYASYASTLFVESLGRFETIVYERATTRGGILLGAAQLDPSDGRLRALFVDAARQGEGLGRALLAEVERRARGHGAVRLHGAMSLNAVSFYLQAGFRPCGGQRRLGSSRVAIPVLRMEKDL